MKKFRSKIGLELAIPLVICLGGVTLLMILGEPGWTGSLIMLPVNLFVVYMFANTYYIIEGNSLKIKCGFLYNEEVNILDIKKIKASNNPLSAPATSLDRLEITHGNKKTVLISPKNKKEFIDEILNLNNEITIINKK